jgi:hypothetical protein
MSADKAAIAAIPISLEWEVHALELNALLLTLGSFHHV